MSSGTRISEKCKYINAIMDRKLQFFSLLINFLQNFSNLFRVVPPRSDATLIDNFPTLNDIEALRQGSVFAGSDVGHLIHYHRAEGVFFDQGPGRSQSLLQVFVHTDVDVVCKGPSISCMGFCKVNNEEICHITEVLDKLFELIKLVEKRGSCAASETQNQWTVPFKKTMNARFLSIQGE